MAKLAQGIDLTITGYRVAPRDPNKKTVAATGTDAYIFSRPTETTIKPVVLKEKLTMGGGYKIQEENVRSRQAKKELLTPRTEEEQNLMDESNIITRDDIIKKLNLASGDQISGTSDSSLTKANITKELVDGLSKELEKLRRQSENIQTRKTLIIEGEIHEETEEEKNYKISNDLEDLGCTVIHAENERVQAQRHQTGQLGGLGAITMEEVVAMRMQTQERVKQLEVEYYKNRDTRFLSSEMRKRLVTNDPEKEAELQEKRRLMHKETEYERLEREANSIIAEKEFRDSHYNPDRPWVRRVSQMKTGDEEEFDPSHLMNSAKKDQSSRSNSKSPRTRVYEAKYNKYKINKKLKGDYDDEKIHKEDFDLYTKGKESAHVKAKKIDWDDLFAQKLKKKLFTPDFPVFEAHYDQRLLQKMLKKLEKLSKEEKLTFSILKWIFNALKKKDNRINTKELINQLDQNIDIIHSLGFNSSEDVAQQLHALRTKTPGKLTWEEFLDFFCSKTITYKKTGEMWWKTEQEDGQIFLPKEEVEKLKGTPETRKSKQLIGAYDRMSKKPDGSIVFEDLETDYKTRDKMRQLTEQRVNRLVDQEIQEEVKALEKVKRRHGDPLGTGSTLDPLALRSEDDIFGSKTRCRLQVSHFEIMKQVFNNTDKFKDGILKRKDYAHALRDDKIVQTFLDHEAIRLGRKEKLTFDEVLKDFEKDQYMNPADSDSDEHFDNKEFVTWEECFEFIHDYKTPEERMRRNEFLNTNNKIPRTQAEKDELKQKQIEEERERRIRTMPRFREEDKIDAEQEYLDIVRNVFDDCNKIRDKPDKSSPGKAEKSGLYSPERVLALEFYMKAKTDPEMLRISDAIAREPSGKSRIGTETFKEVLYRMEETHPDKEIDWATILEYFTKRGKPLSKEEIDALRAQDRQADEDYEDELEQKLLEEEEFDRQLKEEQKELGDFDMPDHLETDDARTDIDDMDHAMLGSSRQDYGANEFRSTFNSKKKVTFKDSLNERDSQFGYDRPVSSHRSGFDETFKTQETEFVSRPHTAESTHMVASSFKPKGSSFKERPQTAKSTSKFDKILGKDSMSGKDYADYKKSKKDAKSSERQLTVPRPFKFDTRDKIRPKSIRERKVDEMIAEKQLQEERAISHTFRAKQPPRDVIVPLFKKIMDKNEQRRKEVKENSMKLLKSQERPFSFYERDIAKKEAKLKESPKLNEEFKKGPFKAKEVPQECRVEIFKVMMDKQDKERQERIKKNAEVNFRKSRLPPRMEMHERRKKEKELEASTPVVKRGKSFEPGRPLHEIGTFEPPRAKPVPDFKRLQKTFQDTLDRKKTSHKLTEPKPFNFTSSSKNPDKPKAALHTYMDRENDSKGFNSRKPSKTGKAPKFKKPSIEPKTTAKQSALEQRRRKELEEKTKKEMERINSNKHRYKSQNKLKGTVQSLYSAMDDTQKKKLEQEERLKSNIEGMKKQEKDNRERIKEMINKGRATKFLVERYQDDLEKQKRPGHGYRAVQMVEEIMKQNAVDPQRVMSEDQKDKLADAKFLEKHRK